MRNVLAKAYGVGGAQPYNATPFKRARSPALVTWKPGLPTADKAKWSSVNGKDFVWERADGSWIVQSRDPMAGQMAVYYGPAQAQAVAGYAVATRWLTFASTDPALDATYNLETLQDVIPTATAAGQPYTMGSDGRIYNPITDSVPAGVTLLRAATAAEIEIWERTNGVKGQPATPFDVRADVAAYNQRLASPAANKATVSNEMPAAQGAALGFGGGAVFVIAIVVAAVVFGGK